MASCDERSPAIAALPSARRSARGTESSSEMRMGDRKSGSAGEITISVWAATLFRGAKYWAGLFGSWGRGNETPAWSGKMRVQATMASSFETHAPAGSRMGLERLGASYRLV